MQPTDLPDPSGPAPGPAAGIPQGTAAGDTPAFKPLTSSAADRAALDGLEDRRTLAAEGARRWLGSGRRRQWSEQLAGHARRSPADGLAPAEPDAEAKVEVEVEEQPTPRQLHPLPPGLVELYGLLAVLFVLVPEWMASGALFGFREGRRGSDLPAPSSAWRRLPELRLASLNLAQLRQLARERRLIGYSRQSREQLSARLLQRLKARP